MIYNINIDPGITQLDTENNYLNLMMEIEEEIQNLIEAFDNMDLIRIRQCSGRIHSNANVAWKCNLK